MTDSTVMACPSCERTVSAAAHFCSFCRATLSCGRCGTRTAPGELFCSSCGTRLDMSWTEPTSTRKYAGFWRRFAAYSIDGLVLLVAAVPLALALAFIFGPSSDSSSSASVSLLLDLVSIAGGWLYFALMESSSKQATLGKMAVGIKVTDENGERLSLGRASGRYFAKVLSGLTLGVGYLMAGLTKKKQALHDKVANTLVVVSAG